MLFISIIGFINVKPRSHKSTLTKNMSFKKIESFTKDTMLSDSCVAKTSSDKYDFDTKITNSLNETITNQLSPNIVNDYKHLCMENSATPKSKVFQGPL